MGYDILVMALNKKGKSGPLILQGFTVKNPEKQTGKRAKGFLRLRNGGNFEALTSLEPSQTRECGEVGAKEG